MCVWGVYVPLVCFTVCHEVVGPHRSDDTKGMFPGPFVLNNVTR